MLNQSRQARWVVLVVAAVLLMSAALFAQRTGVASAQEPLSQTLGSALLGKDYAMLAATAAPEISVVRWMGDRRILPATDALDELQSAFLDDAEDPYLDNTTNLAQWFGIPPVELWQDAAVVNSVLFLRGLGADGAGELLLGIDDSSSTTAHWSALLFAAAGFGAPDTRAQNGATAVESVATVAPAAAAAPLGLAGATSAAGATVSSTPSEINLLRTVNVYPGPDPDIAPAGVLRRGQTLPVLGLSANGDYLQIECPSATMAACWVINDPGAVEAIGVAEDAGVADPAPEAMSADTAPAGAAAADTAAGATRIAFPPGEVAATRTGVVEPAATQNYVMRVLAGQMLTVDLISGGDVANFSVTGVANGQPYKRIENEARNWTFLVPVTQDYLIRIVAAVPTQYSLTVIVPPLAGQPTATWTPQPLPTQTVAAAERINFAGGAISAERSGRLNAGESKGYVIRVLRGQNVITEINSMGRLGFSIVAADGTPIKRRDVGGSPFIFTAPATQDYTIAIYAQDTLDYGLTVTVPPLQPNATATPVAPVRLSVPLGGTSVSTTNIADPGGRNAYLVRAIGGQTMYVSVQSPENIANFSIVGVSDGQPLKRLENEDRSWSGTLPATQDYLITVANPRMVRVQYTLNISFSPLQGNAPTATPRPSGPPQRIAFPAGGTSATVSGNAPQSYILRALAGQIMSVQLYAEGSATFSVAGADGTVLKSSGTGASGWSGDLPSNQDYIITVIPVSGSTAFTLVVTVVF